MDIGLLVYPRFTPLELIGPWEVLVRLPDAQSHFIWTRPGPVLAERGIEMTASVAFAETPHLDVLVVPGGPGQLSLMKHTLLMEFLRERAAAGVNLLAASSGTLLLAQAGVLRGRRATTYWLARETLRSFDVEVVDDEHVVDGNIATAAGASAAIEVAFQLVRKLAGDEAATEIQLELDYNPTAAFTNSGPDAAPPEIVERLRKSARQFR